MTHMRLKLLIGTVVIVGTVVFLAVAGMRSGWVYYVDVDPFMADAQYHTQRVRLAGRVSEQTVADPAVLGVSFDLLGRERRLPVVYRGVVPEMFKPGCNVVVEGKLDEAGVFQADQMLTKCASKYETEDHAKKLSAPKAVATEDRS